MHLSKKLHFIICCSLFIALLLQPAYPEKASAEQQDSSVTGEAVTFPIAFQRATGDRMHDVATDNKGTILTISDNYLNITCNYGKTWQARSLPSSTIYYSIRYAKGVYYLSNGYNYTSEAHYYSTDGVKWTPFYLYGAEGTKLGIQNIREVNGIRILTATNDRLDKMYVYTSKDGFAWVRQSAIPHIVWGGGADVIITSTGKGFTAIAGGYRYYNTRGSKYERNQFDIGEGAAELIVYTSPDLKQWTMQSGTVKKLTYDWNMYNLANGEFVPARNYHLYEEQPVANGVIRLYDVYSNQLTSTNGISFTLKPAQKIFHAYSLSDYRTPIYQHNGQYVVFTQYWFSPGVLHTRLLTSPDCKQWKETKLKSALDNMYVMQAGDLFLGFNDKEMAISSDGLQWKRIK